jgi:hypothetical protein
MNCDTYLSMLATLPVDELADGDAGEHADQCRDCQRVTAVVMERERNMLIAYGALYPSVPAAPITARALVLSRRRRIAGYYRIGLGVALVMTLLSFVVTRRVVPATVSQTVRLQCLSPEQAMALLRPAIPPSVSMSTRASSPLGVIQITASPKEMERVRSVLDRYDTPTASQCGVELTLPKDIKAP